MELIINEHAIMHIHDSNYCFATGKDSIVLRLRVQRDEPLKKVSVIHACKYVFHDHRQEVDMEKKYSDRLFDFYEVEIKVLDVRIAYIFHLKYEELDYYYSEDGLLNEYDFSLGYYSFFQLPYIHESDITKTVEWMKSAVFYEIFVDRFYRGSKEKKDSYITMEWGEIPSPKSFAGGDLPGIMEKLDYLIELGVNTLYLTPIFTSTSNHKYDIVDYKQIDPHFGTNDDFRSLVETAHKKGVRIVLDAVFNHCGIGMEQFQDVLRKGTDSSYYHWFLIDGEKPDREKANYERFAFCNYMPKLNTEERDVRDFLLDIGRYWIREYDIDGWRLDVSDEISHDFWREFRKVIKNEKKDCVIIGENWHNAYGFLMGDQYDGIMNYAFTKSCLDLLAFETLDAQGFAWKLNHLLMRNKAPINTMMMNLLDSHDTYRFYTEILRNTQNKINPYQTAKSKLLAALAIMTCFTGSPCIYYGTEICMEGGYDPDCRRTFDWEERNWDMEVMDTIKSILALKKYHELQDGQIRINSSFDVLIMIREGVDNSIILLYNHGKNLCSKEDLEQLLLGVPYRELVWNQYSPSKKKLMPGGFIIVKQKNDNESK